MFYCGAAIIRSDDVVLPRAPRRTARVRLRCASSGALSARRLRRFVAKTHASSGLGKERRFYPSRSGISSIVLLYQGIDIC